jgi:hypothetical protein
MLDLLRQILTPKKDKVITPRDNRSSLCPILSEAITPQLSSWAMDSELFMWVEIYPIEAT